MIDNPASNLEALRGIVAQIAKGLQAFHSLEMLHQNLRPGNIMIDETGAVKIIDFGSSRVAGLAESDKAFAPEQILGTFQYAAPEFFLGEGGTNRSDILSLGVVAYEMFRGKLPCGARVAQCRTRAALRNLVYDTRRALITELPAYVSRNRK